MSQPNGSGSDPIDRLRVADPVRADGVPDASLARVTARIQEHIVTDTALTPAQRPSRRPFAVFGGVVLAGAFALAVAVGTGLGVAAPSGDPGIGTGNGAAGGGGMASCLAYDPAILPTFDVVFDGTVAAVDGDQVTFDVNEGWKGASDSITLTAPAADIALTGPIPAFEVGSRYLVTAAGSTINACGFSLAYDADTAASWAAAFAS